MEKKDLDQLKKIELEIANYFIDICEKNNLTYYIFWGTLLGCIRHKGFIPWDDDIDVVMPPSDYLKFLDIIKQEKNDKYYLQNISNTPFCPFVFSKIRKYHTTMVEEEFNYLPFKKGINIDIFPLIKYPKGKCNQLLFKYRFRLAILLVNRNVKGHDFKTKAIYYLLHLIPRKVCEKIVANKMNKLLSYNGEFDEYYVRHNIGFDKKLFKKITKPFEDVKVIVPEGYDAILTKLYGDYMTPPPEDKRYGHGSGGIILSFTKDYDEM